MAKNKKKKLTEFELHLLEKRRAARRVVLFSILKFILVVSILTVVVWGLLFSPLFHVRNVTIMGLENDVLSKFVDQEKIESIFDDIKNDDAPSLVWVSTDGVSSELEKVHGVQSAGVAKSWPNSLVVIITPRKGVGHIGDQLIDEVGDVLGEWTSEMTTYPELVVANDAKADVLALIKAISNEPISAPGFSKILATSRDDITFVRNDGYTIVFGNTNKLTLKLSVAESMLAMDLSGRMTIDLSSPTDPVAR
jgi:cell division septal protein FtsQ